MRAVGARTKLKPVADQVMVITGASSGIGLATALAASAKGAKVVLVARTAEALARAADRITEAGGQAIAIEADVGSRAALEEVARAAVTRFGRIDTWVNNAGVAIWARTEEISEADMRQLFETNFWGQVNGSLVAIPHLERQGGALINIGSVVGDRAVPFQGFYGASKFAVKGYTEALRMDLEQRGAGISVTLIKPAAIGTPMPGHIRAYTAREPRFPPPVYAPEEVARAILYAASHPVRDLSVGSFALMASAAGRWAPRLVDKIGEAFLFEAQLGKRPPEPGDNLDHGWSQVQVRADHPESWVRPSVYTRLRTHPRLSGAVLGGVALAGLGAVIARTRPSRTMEKARG